MSASPLNSTPNNTVVNSVHMAPQCYLHRRSMGVSCNDSHLDSSDSGEARPVRCWFARNIKTLSIVGKMIAAGLAVSLTLYGARQLHTRTTKKIAY